jgi:DNA-binding transcriptional LysR family regulator
MNFNQLLIFHKVAEKKHFTRAAEELYISQPAVSKQVQELEKSLGQPLFMQVGRKIYLTEAGELLFGYTSKIFALSAEAQEVLDELRSLERGHLAVGASTTVGTYLLPELLGQYRARYPHIELFLDIANTEDIQQRLLANKVEIGIIEGNVNHSELAYNVWRVDELVLIVSPQHPLAQSDVVPTLQQVLFEHAAFILREPGSGTREVLEEAIAGRGMPPIRPLMELGSTEAIKQVVRANLGISFVSQHTIQLELRAGLLKQVPLADFQLTRPLSIVYSRQKHVSRAARALLDTVDERSPGDVLKRG